jgi:excisionase family DNA binding protein
MATPEPTPCMPVARVAELLGVSRDAVYDLIHHGHLPAVAVGAPGRRPRLVVSVTAYEAFVAAGGVSAGAAA